MSINAKSAKSIKKTDLQTQKTPFIAFKSFRFAHEATAGQTVISLAALTTPASYLALGFVQPSASDITAANLLANGSNLRIISSLRGLLIYSSYKVSGNLTITLLFPAEAGEIFEGTISDAAKSGLQVIDGSNLVSTGSLPAGSTDYAVGQSFTQNKFPLRQVGDVLVFLEGDLLYRNTGNATASVSADGNYEEVSAGGGLSNVIRFNKVDPTNARAVTVISNGMLAERPEGSLRAEIETLAGQLDQVISTLAQLAGVATTSFYGAPNSVDLQSFGTRLINMELNRARIDLSNTWTAYQALLGRTDGLANPAGYVGEKVTGTYTTTSLAVSGTTYNPSSITLTPGIWFIKHKCPITAPGSTRANTTASISAANSIGTTNGNNSAKDSSTSLDSSQINVTDVYFVTATATYYATAQAVYTGTAPAATAGEFFAVRIA